MNVIKLYNEKHPNDAIGKMLKQNKLIPRSGNDFTYNLNTAEQFAYWNGTYLEILGDFPEHKKGEKLMPFDLLCKYGFKDNVSNALASLILKYGSKNLPYVRVGSDYFKLKTYTNGNDEKISDKLIPYLKGEIKEDFGSDAISKVAKFDEFGMYPNNIDYKQVVDGNYNNYSKVYHAASKYDIKKDPDKIYWSMVLMKHIFGDQLDIGMNYMKLIWENPKQILPILVLASVERQTGKTTFANWMEMIYRENHVSIGVGDMKGDFNAHISEKLIIVIEETVSESHSLVNRIKMISTAKKMLVNKKNISQYSVDFYGKILILTNKPDKFLQVDSEEIRFWVRSIPKITEGNHNIENDLLKELPYFLYYLNQLPKVDTSKSRMVFTPEELGTEALKVIKKESKSALEKDMVMYLEQWCLQNADRPVIRFTAIDIKNQFFARDSKINISRIGRTLKEMEVPQKGKNGRYRKFDDVESSKSGNGNYFRFVNKHSNAKEHEGDLPF